MRKLAWRLGWLDRSIDPLDGLEIGRASVLHGATARYVDRAWVRRPERCAPWPPPPICCSALKAPTR